MWVPLLGLHKLRFIDWPCNACSFSGQLLRGMGTLCKNALRVRCCGPVAKCTTLLRDEVLVEEVAGSLPLSSGEAL